MEKPIVPASVIDSVVSLCKRRGFVFPSGEIYGGTKSAWDYGPLGVELKENIKRQWWRSMVTTRDDVVGLDSSMIPPTGTWEASGHLDHSAPAVFDPKPMSSSGLVLAIALGCSAGLQGLAQRASQRAERQARQCGGSRLGLGPTRTALVRLALASPGSGER
jgi:hypothetical protein